MSTARVSRGFHRLGLFLAAVPLLIGVGFSFFSAKDYADTSWQTYQKADCAFRYIQTRAAEAKLKTNQIADRNIWLDDYVATQDKKCDGLEALKALECID